LMGPMQTPVVSDDNSKAGAIKTQIPPKTKSNGAAPVRARSEVRRKRGGDNVTAEVERPRKEVATRLRVAIR
jgi:hypothetical protein